MTLCLPGGSRHFPPQQHHSPHLVTKQNLIRFMPYRYHSRGGMALPCSPTLHTNFPVSHVWSQKQQHPAPHQHHYPHLLTKQNAQRFTTWISDVDCPLHFKVYMVVNLIMHYGCAKSQSRSRHYPHHQHHSSHLLIKQNVLRLETCRVQIRRDLALPC